MKKKKPADSKAWASFRIRGAQTTIKSTAMNSELSMKLRRKLAEALDVIDEAVDILNEERDANEKINGAIR